MVAGLFAAHGVFFGETVGPDEHNEKGYFEHHEIVRRTEGGTLEGWPAAWWDLMRAEGCPPGGWWGIKRGPQAWPWVKLLLPDLIVLCKRPIFQMVRSRRRRWPNRERPRHEVLHGRRDLARVLAEAPCPVVTVRTDRMVGGDYRQINKAFHKLGLWLDVEKTDGWIDKSLWNRGPGR
jgi:hypothetical protein